MRGTKVVCIIVLISFMFLPIAIFPERKSEIDYQELEHKETNILIEPKDTEIDIAQESNMDTSEKTELEYNVDEINEMLYANTNVNIRKFPAQDSDKIGYLRYGQSIEAIGVCDNGWTQVRYKGCVAYISSKYLQETVIEVEEENTENQSYSGIIQREGNVPDSMLDSIDYYYSMIPSNVRNYLEVCGWKYVCSNEDFAGKYGYTHSVLALTVYEDRLIYIDNRNSAQDAILHEAGHAFDASMGFISDNSSEFTDIYNEEKESFCEVWSTHANNTESASEYFAEAFYVLMVNPNLVSTNCPRTYEYIMRYINSVD